jgi:hypothetical protein
MSTNTILASAPLTTTNFILKATGTTIGNSLIFDNGTNVGIGNTNTSYTLDVSGTGRFTGTLTGAAGTFAGNLSVTGNNLFTLATTNTSARIGEYDAANRICLTANQNGANAQDDATKPSWGLVFNANSTDTFFIGHKAAGGGSAALSALMTMTGTGVTTFTNTIDIALDVTNSTSGLNLVNNKGSGYGNSLNYYTSTTKFGSIQVESSAANTSEMAFKTMVGSTLATRMFISSAGNVGIGTSSPSGLGRALVVTNTSDYPEVIVERLSSGAGKFGMLIGNSGDFLIRNYTAGTNPILITSDGDVYMGSSTTDKTSRLVAYGSTTTSAAFAIRAFSSGSDVLFGARNDGLIVTGTLTLSPYNYSVSGRPMQVNSGGVIGYNTSVREAKDNIKSIEDVSWIYSLNPVSYNKKMKDNEGNYTNELYDNIEYGFIADEVEKVNEDFVFYDIKDDGTKKLAGFEYNNMIAILTKAIQELRLELNELKNK